MGGNCLRRMAICSRAGSNWVHRFRTNRIEGFAGEVDYDGAVFNEEGDTRPYRSDTAYGGVGGETLLSFALFQSGGLTFYPEVGAGAQYWLRQLDVDGDAGYDEYWLTAYGVAGLRLEADAGNGSTLFLRGAILIPFYNDEEVENIGFDGVGNVSLEPETEIGYTAEAGIMMNSFTVSAFYEYLEFGESDLDDTGRFFQPDSETTRIGVKAGIKL